jgi:hypothetical protein
MRLRRILFGFISCLLAFSAFGQIRILPGTSMTIAMATSISINVTSADTLKIESGAQVNNNGKILLAPSVIIQESAGFPISGLGYEEFADLYTAPVTGINPGGLGFILTTTVSPDSLRIKRYHSALSNNGMMGIGRSYEISAQNDSALGGSAIFNYDGTELNGLNSTDLMLYQSDDNGTSWHVLNGNTLSSSVQSAAGVIDSLSLFSLFAFDFRIDSLNALSFYHGDSIRIYYTLNGSLNPGNILKFEFSDETGSFIVPFVLDSLGVQSGQGVLTRTIPAALVAGNQYRIRLKTTDILLISADNGADITIMEPEPLSIDDNSAQGKFEIYPNPANGILYVRGKEASRIIITNELGQTVINKKASASTTQIELTDLPPAVYTIAIETQGHLVYKRFIKI